MNNEQRQELKDKIVQMVAEGSNINAITKLDDMPNRQTVYNWFASDKEFLDNYARAREDRADARADRIDEIVVELMEGKITSDVARVAIDTYKWQAGKEKPTRYGDKQQVELTHKNFFDQNAK